MHNLRLPADSGSYLLWFYLPTQQAIDVGRLGLQKFKRGWYLYCGSAFGPGGLRARVKHHLEKSERKHWHIDYLNGKAELRAVWFCRAENHEHDWSSRLMALPGARKPVEGFGSSDCKCSSHLVYLPKKSSSGVVRGVLEGDCRIERRRVFRAGE